MTDNRDHSDHDHAHHRHGHAHDHTAGAAPRALALALALTAGFLLVEILGAWFFVSLALLSDAAHMFTDCAALAIALAAAHIGQFAADERRTFGYRRFEVLAAAFNATLLVLAATWILYESVRRLITPTAVEPLGMLLVAVAGLVVNLIGMRVLSGQQGASLNMKGAYLEVWADALGSVGVIAGAVLIWLTGYSWIDPIVAVAIALWVLPRTWNLLSNATHILMQGVPPGIDLTAIRARIAGIAGVADVHDLHVWSVAGDDISLTAHVVLASGAAHDVVRTATLAALEGQFGIHHVTLQTEDIPCETGEHLHA
ncbi:MAG: cation diffusion facilitator family transporter [Paracoccaceae bacterium]